eukprot:Skav201172  [mRNA]  locus=scaffold65:774040:778439:- [translate_table: standard]
MVVMALNFWYAGSHFGDMELLRRNPSSHHHALFRRIRVLVESEGPCEIQNLPSKGRRFPELCARIAELSQKLTELGVSADPYEKKYAGVKVEKQMPPPELQPFHDLDPERIKLFGTGDWDATSYLSDELVMAYREPASLLHAGPPGDKPSIRDTPESVAKLAKKWDELGLLLVHSQPIDPHSLVRIFGATKDSVTDRQIGDRRGRNGLEAKVVGPSHELPSDHAGVEIATQAHTSLLQREGLLEEGTTLVANKPLKSTSSAQGLVIDDFFSVSVQEKGLDPTKSRAYLDYQRAQVAYRRENLLGSPHKDHVAEDCAKAIGATINGGRKALEKGVVTLAAPAEKRMALAYLSLQIAQLTYTSDALHLCLIGGWVSVIGFRRPMMSVLNKAFHVVDIDAFNRDDPKLVPLSREVANELVLLSVLFPLALTELSAPFDDTIYCTDASMSRGAALSARVPPVVAETLWKVSRSKGAYTRLQSPLEVVLDRLDQGANILERSNDAVGGVPRPLCHSFEFIEVFAGASRISSYISKMDVEPGPPLDLSVSPEYDVGLLRVISWLTWMVAEKRLKGFALGPPYTTFSIMRRPRLRSRDSPFGFDTSDPQTSMGNKLAHRGCQLMEVGHTNDACGILETPHSSYMKHLPPWIALKRKRRTHETRCDSCQYGSPHRKSFRLMGLNLDMGPLSRRCKCKGRHLQVQGSFTKDSAVYTHELAYNMALVISEGIKRQRLRMRELDSDGTRGLESVFANEIMQTAEWEVVADWVFKKSAHINILEEAALLKLCTILAKKGLPRRVSILVDSSVVRFATSKGRTSSVCLGSVLRRVSALAVASGLYISVPYTPTRLNCADDPTRNRAVRDRLESMGMEHWDLDEVYEFAILPKYRRWAANWIRLLIRMVGSKVLFLHHRNIFRSKYPLWFDDVEVDNLGGHDSMEFDATKGYPGEGPSFSVAGPGFMANAARSCRWTFFTGAPLATPSFSCVWRLLVLTCVLSACSECRGFPVGALAMPMSSKTPGELRRAAERRARPALPAGRPVTEATSNLRRRYWELFTVWAAENGYDIQSLLAAYHGSVDAINQLLINQHHIAAPYQIVLAMLSVALLWGWKSMAGAIALSFGALLRPGELLASTRADLLLPSDVDHSQQYAILSIKEPKSRFTTARHQAARLDSADLIQVVEMCFSSLRNYERLWPFSGQTYRARFRAILVALRLPTKFEAGLRSLDPGSLRSGGATWIMMVSENSELCRRRGRWASMRMMEVYVQETMAVQYLRMIPDDVRSRVMSLAKVFPAVLQQAMLYSQASIPTDAWYLLFSQKQKP